MGDAGEEAGEGRPDAQRRAPGEAQEVWCSGSKVGAGSVVATVILIFVFGAPILGGFFIGGHSRGGGIVLAAVVGVIGLMFVVRMTSRLVIRMEPGKVMVKKRPFGWGAVASYRAADVQGVRVGVNTRRMAGQGGQEKTCFYVVLRLVTGEHVWLVRSDNAEELRSVVWEVADYYGLAMEARNQTGVVTGKWWVPTTRGEPDFSGVEELEEDEIFWRWDARRGSRLEVTERRVTIEPGPMRHEPIVGVMWVLLLMAPIGAFYVSGGWSKLYVPGRSGHGGDWGFWGLLLLFCGVWAVVWLVVMENRPAGVVADESGVRISRWYTRRFYSAGRVGWVDVGFPVAQTQAGRHQRQAEDARGEVRFSVRLILREAPDSPMVLVDGITSMAHAVGLARMIQRRVLRGAAIDRRAAELGAVGEIPGPGYLPEGEGRPEEVRAGPAKASGENISQNPGRVRIYDGRWLAGVMMAPWVGIVVVTGLICAQWAWVDWTREWTCLGAVGVAALMAWLWRCVMVFGTRRWMELGETTLTVRRGTWFGVKTLYQTEKTRLERAWVYRAMAYRAPTGGPGHKDRLALELKPGDGRCELPDGYQEVGTSPATLAGAINAWLGVAHERDVVRPGVRCGEVFLPMGDAGEVEVPESFDGDQGVEGRTHVMEEREGCLAIRRKVGMGGMALWTQTVLFAVGVAGCLGVLVWVSAAGWGVAAVVLGVWFLRLVGQWLLEREWAQVRVGEVETQKLSGLSFSRRKVMAGDVEDVCVTAELGFSYWKKERVVYAVNLRMMDGEYVRVATGIESVGEAGEIRRGIWGKLQGV